MDHAGWSYSGAAAVISALSRSGWRGLLTHPGQLALAVIGVMAGVAVVVGVDLTRVSAMRAMTLSNEAVLGRATHRISSSQGALDETVFLNAREVLRGHADVTPVLEGWVSVESARSAVRVLGVDPLSEASFERVAVDTQQWVNGRTFVNLIAKPGAFFATAQTASSYGWSMGATVPVRVNGRTHGLLLAGWLNSGPGNDDLLLMDVATAQELLQSMGTLSYVDVRLDDPGAAEQLFAPLRGSGLQIRSAGSQLSHALKMTRSFYTNLTALSLLAALVGAFLVFNTMSFLVLQRRSEMGVLRALGVTASELFWRTLLEALAIGLAASLLGLAVGVMLAHALVGLVTQTINDLYYAVTVRQLNLTPWLLFKALIIGVGSSLIAAALPAIRAAKQPPRLTMRATAYAETAVHQSGRYVLGSVLSFGAAVFLLAGPARSVLAGFVGLFALLAGFALLTPLLMRWVLRLLSSARWVGISTRTSLACGLASAGRLSLATSALMVALAAVIGIGLMILSFRASVDTWLQQLLRADVYVSVQGPRSAAARGALDGEFVGRLSRSPGIRAVTTVWSIRIDGTHSGEASSWAVSVYGLTQEAFSGFQILEGDEAGAWDAFNAGAVMISEPLARHKEIAPGDDLSLLTSSGLRSFNVAAVYRDYGSDEGVIAMSRALFAQHWSEPGISGIGLYLADGNGIEEAKAALDDANQRQQVLAVQDSRSIRSQALSVFDRTFAVTQALRALAAVVAMVGVFSALMALQTERAREFGMLRVVGFTKKDMTVMSLTQCVIVGLVAGLLAVPAGLAICVGLIDGINLRSFGWSVDLVWTWGVFAGGVLLALLSAVVAGLVPAIKLGRMPIRSLRRS